MRWFVVVIVILLVVNLAALVLYHLFWDAVERNELPESAERSERGSVLDVSPARPRRLARAFAMARQRAK